MHGWSFIIIFFYYILQNVKLILQVLNRLLVTKFVDFLYCAYVSRRLTPGPVHLTLSSWTNLFHNFVVLRDFPVMLVLYHVLISKHCVQCQIIITLNRFDWLYAHSLYNHPINFINSRKKYFHRQFHFLIFPHLKPNKSSILWS